MASGDVVGEEKEVPREKKRFSEENVYRRKAYRGSRKNNNNINSVAIAGVTTPTTTASTTTTTTHNNNNGSVKPDVAVATTISENDKDNGERQNENNNHDRASVHEKDEGERIGDKQEDDSHNIGDNEKDDGHRIGNNENSDRGGDKEEDIQGGNIEKDNQDKVGENNNDKGEKSGDNHFKNSAEGPPQTLVSGDANSAHEQTIVPTDATVGPDNNSISNHRQRLVLRSARDQAPGNGVVEEGIDGRLKINLVSSSRQTKRELRKKLESELDVVRNLVKRIEITEGQIRGMDSSRLLVRDGFDNGGKRIPSEMTTAVVREVIRHPRSLDQLNVSGLENSRSRSEYVEKEKRTPKANQFYRNSEFLLAKDKFPPAESNRKSKHNAKKQGAEHGFGPHSKIFKNCSALLERLIKHKLGWVFDKPVDVVGLGLHDYFTIIKHPMDLGTVKARLQKNWYKSPREFAEDVRLTFRNAMTYNPKGQDVHFMAEQLLKVFEDRWVIIEADYDREMRYYNEYEIPLPIAISRRAPPVRPPPIDIRRTLDRSESITPSIDRKSKPLSTTPSSRTPAGKKPKARDENKREMTYDEKQRLSVNLQNLPLEKLDQIVLIIRKRNAGLCQHDDEIEVDIDSVDTETLWELDRFVTNYKKSLSKNKRKAEQAQAKAAAQGQLQAKTPLSVMEQLPKEDNMAIGMNVTTSAERQGDNASDSSSSSSSSSDSGSSSSDSDSESSSASGSDTRHSPQT